MNEYMRNAYGSETENLPLPLHHTDAMPEINFEDLFVWCVVILDGQQALVLEENVRTTDIRSIFLKKKKSIFAGIKMVGPFIYRVRVQSKWIREFTVNFWLASFQQMMVQMIISSACSLILRITDSDYRKYSLCANFKIMKRLNTKLHRGHPLPSLH